MTTVKMNADTNNTYPSSSAMVALSANEPMQAQEATTIRDVLSGLLYAWKDVCAIERALGTVTDECVYDALCDARNEASAYFKEAVAGARTMTVANDGCATCQLLGVAVERVVRAHDLCVELWEDSAYRNIGKNPAEVVLDDAICAAREILALTEQLQNASRLAA
jgi:hypothetical protein